DHLAQRLGRQPLSQRIDRLDHGQAGKIVRLHYIIGVGHLLFPSEKSDLPRNVSDLSDRQLLFDPSASGAEKDQRDIPGLVMRAYPERRTAVARRDDMLVDMELERRNRTDRRGGDPILS